MTQRKNIKTLVVFFGALLAAGLLALASFEEPARAAFPGSTGAIAFSSDRGAPGAFEIYRMNADGFGQTKLSDQPGIIFSPSWSYDGKRLLFSNNADFGTPGDIYAMNADGSAETNLTNVGSDESGPSYGPAGGKIVFTSNRADNQNDVYVMTIGAGGQTTGLTRLTTDPATDFAPVISPDGKRVLFVSNRDGDQDIYLMKLAPEGPKNVPVKLTKNTPPKPGEAPYMYDFTPDWSPDGTQLVFASDRGGDLEIYRMKAAPESSTNRPVNLSGSPGSRDTDPAYSPDNRKVVFTTDRDGNSEVYRMRATDGANPTNLSNNPATDFLPAWQPLP